jgi:hypothetical protein
MSGTGIGIPPIGVAAGVHPVIGSAANPINVDVDNGLQVLANVATAASLAGVPVHHNTVVEAQIQPPVHLAGLPTQARLYVVGTFTIIDKVKHGLTPFSQTLTDDEKLQAFIAHYRTYPFLDVARSQPQFGSIDEVVASKYLWGAQGVSKGEEHLALARAFNATHQYRTGTNSRCLNATGNVCNLEQSTIDAIHYLHIGLATEIPADLKRSLLGQIAEKNLQKQKLGTAAYVIFALGMGCDTTFARRSGENLKSFQATDPKFFYGYIVPLALTISLLMDNENDRNLSVGSILNKSLDSFLRNLPKKMEKGVWSVAGLQKEDRPNLRKTEAINMTKGLEFNIYRILKMLVKQEEPITPDMTKWFLSPNETNLFNQQHIPINAVVVDRATNKP